MRSPASSMILPTFHTRVLKGMNNGLWYYERCSTAPKKASSSSRNGQVWCSAWTEKSE